MAVQPSCKLPLQYFRVKLLPYIFPICCLSQVHCGARKFLGKGPENYNSWKEILADEIAKDNMGPPLEQNGGSTCMCFLCMVSRSVSNGGIMTPVTTERRMLKKGFIKNLMWLMIKHKVSGPYYPKLLDYISEDL